MPKNILLVDDDRMSVELVKRKLQEQGYEIRSAGNGAEALELLKSKIPDLIVLDVHMPDMDGYAFIMERNKTPQYTKIPVVMVTAAKETGPLFKRHGVKAYLIKPIQMQELLDTVNKIVGPANA